MMQKLKNYLKRIGEFKEAVWAREKKTEEENDAKEMKKEELRAMKFAEAIELVLENKVTPEVTTRATTQLVKARPPSLWSGQSFIDGRLQ